MQRAAEAGVVGAASGASAAADADVVVTMLPIGQAPDRRLCGAGSLLAAAKPKTLFIDCSTVDVASARVAHEAAREGGDALGRRAGVRRGRRRHRRHADLHGGRRRKSAASAAEPILAAMGKRIVHCGAAGAGQAAKICNNMILGISMIAVSRSLRPRREARPVASGAVRRRLDLLRPVLVADQLLPGSRPGPGEPGE